MKCNAWVTRNLKTKSKLHWYGRYYRLSGHTEIVEIDKAVAAKYFGVDEEAVSECGGKIIAEVKAEDEPHFGGTSAELRVNYKCDKCGCTSFLNLPDEYNISKWLTGKIEEL